MKETVRQSSFTGKPKDMLSKAQKWASASIGAPLEGNMGGHFFHGVSLLEELL